MSETALPRGWQTTTLEQVATLIAGQSPPSEFYRDEPIGLPFFQGKADFGPLSPVARKWCERPYKVAEPGDILLSVRAPVGPTNLADQRACIGRGLCAIRAGSRIDRRYLLHVLRRNEGYLAGLGSGNTFQAISTKTVAQLRLSLPPLAEQRRIADQLDAAMADINAARAALARQQTLASRARALTFAGLIRQGDWLHVPLIDLCAGKGQYGLSLKAHAHPAGYPMLRMGNIQDGSLDWTDVTYVDLDDDTFEAYRLRSGDVLLNRTNSAELVGKTAYVERDADAVFASYLVRFRPKPDRLDGRYLTQIINSPIGRTYIERHMGRAVGQVNISAGKMHDFPVPCPPLDQQQAIMHRVQEVTEAADATSAALSRQAAALDALGPAILAAAFRGEL